LTGTLTNPDQYIEVGDKTLPAANTDYRGFLCMTRGAPGARDVVYMCLKSDSDTYSWVQIADGGA
jgi:hypothetical protein